MHNKKRNCTGKHRIIAEVVYVLKGVYAVSRKEIAESLLGFLEEVEAAEPEI